MLVSNELINMTRDGVAVLVSQLDELVLEVLLSCEAGYVAQVTRSALSNWQHTVQSPSCIGLWCL